MNTPDRLTEIKARVEMGYVHDSWAVAVADLEYALGEIGRLKGEVVIEREHYDLICEQVNGLVLQSDRLRAAVSFCRDIATEEYDYQQCNVGAECALRHIIEKCDAALEESK